MEAARRGATDDKDQLTNETSARNGGWNHTNEYDDAGNPTKFKNNTRTYDSDNQLTTGSMTYDGNGNPTTYAGATLTYDENNRVTSIGSLLTCGYRADGQRAWKQGSTGGKTYFLYDQGNPVVEMNSSGTVTATNVYAPDGLVGRKEGSNAWAYYSFDMQGNVTQKLSPSEAVTSGRVMDAWGTGLQTLTPFSPDCFGYNAKWGYYYDTQTGLYLCQHRMYDASTGRWLNRDPAGYDGGINLYGYCGNGAVGRADPMGLFAPPVSAVPAIASVGEMTFISATGVGLVLTGAAITGAVIGTAIDDATGHAYSEAVLKFIGMDPPTELPADPRPPRRKKRKCFMIGETMSRVRAAARTEGADTFQQSAAADALYKPNKDDSLTVAENEAWIAAHMAAGDTLYDIGEDVDRKERGPYYKLEKAWTFGYPRIPKLWPGSKGTPAGHF